MSYCPDKFGVHSHSGSGIVMNLVCHKILEERLIKRSCDFIGESLSW